MYLACLCPNSLVIIRFSAFLWDFRLRNPVSGSSNIECIPFISFHGHSPSVRNELYFHVLYLLCFRFLELRFALLPPLQSFGECLSLLLHLANIQNSSVMIHPRRRLIIIKQESFYWQFLSCSNCQLPIFLRSFPSRFLLETSTLSMPRAPQPVSSLFTTMCSSVHCKLYYPKSTHCAGQHQRHQTRTACHLRRVHLHPKRSA